MYERLDSLLKKHGITAYRLAKEVGMSQSSLSEWKRGNSIPKYDKLVKIAQYLTSPSRILTGRRRSFRSREATRPSLKNSPPF